MLVSDHNNISDFEDHVDFAARAQGQQQRHLRLRRLPGRRPHPRHRPLICHQAPTFLRHAPKLLPNVPTQDAPPASFIAPSPLYQPVPNIVIKSVHVFPSNNNPPIRPETLNRDCETCH